MMYKLVHSDAKAPDGTGYNDPPKFFRSMSKKEFAQSQFHSYSFAMTEHRQMHVSEDLSTRDFKGKLIDAQLFWFDDDTGIAIQNDYWEGEVYYYAFGCNHNLIDPNDEHDHVRQYAAGETYVCKKCKHKVSEDWMQLIVSDTGWVMNEMTSISIRGIRDYDRSIQFNRKISNEELHEVAKFLRKTNPPGYIGVGIQDRGNGLYKFNCCHDSSD